MKRAYIYKGYHKDSDDFDLQCIDWQRLEHCIWFQTYFDLSSYVLKLFTDKIIDVDWDKKLNNINIDSYFIEEEIDKIRANKESLIEEYVDIIDCENVSGIPKYHSDIWYFLY